MPPQWLLTAESVFQPQDFDPVVLEINVLERQHCRFVHAETVVVDHGEERAVARGGDRREKELELVLGEVFGGGRVVMTLICAAGLDKTAARGRH